MHMHCGFSDDPARLAGELEESGVAAFSNTVTPDEFQKLNAQFAKREHIRMGLGLHPWWIEAEALETFESAFLDAPYIGEIGLDFLPAHVETRDMQLAAFERIVALCAAKGERLISIHSVRAEREVLDILESHTCTSRCTCILHSYSGPSDQLKRAVELGCLFSVGPRMHSSKKGREYIRILPKDTLLLETDLPSSVTSRASARDIYDSLVNSVSKIAQIRDCSCGEIAEQTCSKGIQLLNFSNRRIAAHGASSV